MDIGRRPCEVAATFGFAQLALSLTTAEVSWFRAIDALALGRRANSAHDAPARDVDLRRESRER